MFILLMPIHLMNEVQMKISMDYYESSFQRGFVKRTKSGLFRGLYKTINERPRRILGYQSVKKLVELTQTA